LIRSKKFSFGACRIAPRAARSFASSGEALSNLMAGLAVTGDDDFHECSEGLSLSLASRQFLTPDMGKIVLRGGLRRLAHLAQK